MAAPFGAQPLLFCRRPGGREAGCLSVRLPDNHSTARITPCSIRDDCPVVIPYILIILQKDNRALVYRYSRASERHGRRMSPLTHNHSFIDLEVETFVRLDDCSVQRRRRTAVLDTHRSVACPCAPRSGKHRRPPNHRGKSRASSEPAGTLLPARTLPV
jgi:hypothetical protein